MDILLIGGTGTISFSVASLLARKRGNRVFLLNRGNHPKRVPEGAEVIQGDISRLGEVRAALAGRRFDVAADFLAYTAEDARRDLELFSGRVGQFVFVSSCATYLKPLRDFPVTEATPQKNPYWDYARQKIAAEQVFMESFRRDGFPVSIVRPSHTYDYRNFPLALRGKKRSWQTILRLRADKRVLIPGDGTSLWTLTHADDFAVGFAGLLGNPGAIGKAVNVVSDDVVTWDQVYGRLAEVLGVRLRAVHVASEALAGMDANLWGELLGDKANSLFFDNSLLRRLVPEFRTTLRFHAAAADILRGMESEAELCQADPEWDEWVERVLARYAPE